MKQHSVVALASIASAQNVPGEYLVAVVHPQTGRLVQRSGCDSQFAAALAEALHCQTQAEQIEEVAVARPVHPLQHVNEERTDG